MSTTDINSSVICPIPGLTIKQDWTPVIKFAETLISKSKERIGKSRPCSAQGNVDFYDMGNIGSVGNHRISQDWNIVSGNWLRKYCTWLHKAEEDLKELGPDFTITIARSDIAEHVDQNSFPTAINYPIGTTSAETYIKSGGQEYTYPSNSNEAWMITTQLPHGVRNPLNELRIAFSIHFATDFATTKTWFDSRPNLVYGN